MNKYPADVETEKKLLSAMMLKDGVIIPQVAGILAAEDFYRPEHRLIFSAMLNIYDKGTPPDVLLIENELRRMGKFDGVGSSYLLALLDMEFTTARAGAQAKIIKDKAQRRRLIETGEKFLSKAYEDDTPNEELITMLESLMTTNAEIDSTLEKIDKSALDVFNRANELSKTTGLTGITTGLIDLNKLTNGLQKSDLIILAARPSMGKTALALNIAQSAADAQKKVAVFSLEMSKNQLAARLLSTISNVAATKINSGDLSDRDFDKLIIALETIEQLPLYVDDTSSISVQAIRMKARRLQKAQGLDLVIVDYIQLMRGKGENRVQEISEISRGLKALAKELGVPVLALSQLSRQVEMRAEKKPQLSDLRDSGSIEQDADMVMFLYRDEYYNRDDPANQNVAELIISKNRNGATGAIRLYFQKDIMRFSDLIRNQNHEGDNYENPCAQI